jgi:acetyl-CoA C-acetyltransferase
MDGQIAIVSAQRTAIGSFMGGISTVPVRQLTSAIIKRVLSDTNVKPEEISEVILGHVLSGGCGQNPARQASIDAGLPVEVPAWEVNKVCGSGLMSIALGADAIRLGRASIILAGGHENMSQVPHGINIRHAGKMGPVAAEDLMIADGLTDAFSKLHMGLTAENIAERFNITREEQDIFAATSQNKAEAARNSGRFKDEIIPIVISTRKGDVVFDSDEYIREGVSADSLSKLRPAFKKDGTVTAGNASGINDGSAVLMLMKHEEAVGRGLKILGKIKSYSTSGVDPSIMGISPVTATKKALSLAGWDIGDLGLIEVNEAFAAQSVYVGRELKWDSSIVNVNGGAIALGHPIGASGARIVVTLLHEMNKRDVKKGIATLCIGGGMGMAMCIER